MDDETTTETKDDVLKLPLPDGMTRMECGPVQFGDDWPGYFLRGDRAFGLLQGRETVLALMETGDTRYSSQLWASASLGAIPDMGRCIVGGWEGGASVSPWMPIETAPRDGTTILVLAQDIAAGDHDRLPPIVASTHYHRHAGFTICDIRYETHWMPMPELPNVGAVVVPA